MLSFLSCLLASSLLLYRAVPVIAYPKPIHSRQSTDQPCAQIFESTYEIFPAKLAYDCLTSAPFNATVALDFLLYYNDTLQFQSTLAYLKNPPPSYQQPPIDVLASLAAIIERVKGPGYPNQYDFEAAVQEVVYATHDNHINLSAGILSAFTFGSPLRIVSVSTDGIALPKIYIPDDLLEALDQDVGWVPSPVATINGQEVTKFLSQFAAINSQGNIEPYADWNQLMSSPAGDIQGVYSSFEGLALFYPGENITFGFENGTSDDLIWLAFYSDSIVDNPPSISSGQDLYNYFVLGQYGSNTTSASTSNGTSASTSSIDVTSSVPTTAASISVVSTTDSASSPTTDASATPSSWDYSPYPTNPAAAQPNLGDLNGGVITGYFLNDGVTAVLSIPSFSVTSEAVLSFSTTIGEFIKQSKAAGLTRFIIDLQRNDGGSDLLATDAFKQFFPSIDPYGGDRLRAHPYADALGNTLTTFYNTQPMDDQFYQQMSGDVWVASVYLNAATGQNFTSWPEFYGPHADNGDFFTTTQRNNLSSIIFDENATGGSPETSNGIVVYGYGNRSATSPQPYDAEQLVLLTDAYCSSACGTFVELMHHQAGVRTVVAGGRPEPGPMQAVGGSRGAQVYDSVALDTDIQVAEILNASVTNVLPDRTVGNFINYADFNLKDAIRPGENLPQQFAYEAATCRILYTKHTVYNYLNLWNYVVDAVWRNPSLCISGSANGTSSDGNESSGPPTNSKDITALNDQSIGTLILTGLDKPPQKRSDASLAKRLDPTQTSTDLRNPANPIKRNLPTHLPKLSTHITDGLLATAGCATCDTRNGFICASIPSCVQGKITTSQSCARSCSQGANPCTGTQHCNLQAGKGFCLSNNVARAVSQCKANPTRTARTQQTRAVGGGNFKAPYAITALKVKKSPP